MSALPFCLPSLSLPPPTPRVCLTLLWNTDSSPQSDFKVSTPAFLHYLTAQVNVVRLGFGVCVSVTGAEESVGVCLHACLWTCVFKA